MLDRLLRRGDDERRRGDHTWMTATPPAVAFDSSDKSLAAYWSARSDQLFHDHYAGILLMKFPEDLRVYEHLLWLMKPDAVIEIGTHSGGSALWFRDRMASFQRYGGPPPRVITMDLGTHNAIANIEAADPSALKSEITILTGDVLDPDLPARVADLLPAGARCLVTEDSAHIGATTAAALKGFARFVPFGGWFVVEDGVVDDPNLKINYDHEGGGVQQAVADWLTTDEGSGFDLRRDLEIYGMTCHPHGYLQRARP
jgi:cephalosporin hydroxylase